MINMNENHTQEIDRIKKFIQNKVKDLGKVGAVVPLSGGLDSAVTATLTVRALGADRVKLLNLYERDSKREHIAHAEKFAAFLGCEFIQRDISSVLRAAGSYSLLPIRLIPVRSWRQKLVEYGRKRFIGKEQSSVLEARLKARADSWEARGNAYAMAKHRMRMVLAFLYAEEHNLMEVGAANRTEWFTGTFSKFGVDHCADIMPIVHLYRSEVEELARQLDVPDYILSKAADPDVLPGLDDKQVLLGDFKQVDQILILLENNEEDKLGSLGLDQSLVDRIVELRKLSAPMRESPYSLPRN